MAKCTNIVNLLNFNKPIYNTIYSLDSILYILIGSIIAGIGLVNNNTNIVNGSMLISPIGNSIILYISGIVLHNKINIYRGLFILLSQIIIGIVTGYIIGIIYYKDIYHNIKHGEEMEKRTKDLIIYDIIIASLAGFVLTYSLITKNFVAIAGVGLIVSILPPLVNTGLYTSVGYYKSDMNIIKKGLKSFLLSIVNIAFISLSCIIGFYFFC